MRLRRSLLRAPRRRPRRCGAALAPILALLLLAGAAAAEGTFSRVSSRPEPASEASAASDAEASTGAPAASAEGGAGATPQPADTPPAARDASSDAAGPPAAEEATPEDEEAPSGERTWGTACIYGAGGRVLYAPEGKHCEPDATAAGDLRGRESVGDRAPGRCILGPRGVLHAPPGVICDR